MPGGELGECRVGRRIFAGSRLRGRHKRSDTIRGTACLVGYGCSNRDILPRLAECVRTKARGLVVVTGHIPCTASGAGAGLDFELKEQHPRPEGRDGDWAFRRRAVFKCRLLAKCFPKNSWPVLSGPAQSAQGGNASGDRLEGPLRPAIVLFLVRMLVESASRRRAPLSRQVRPAL